MDSNARRLEGYARLRVNTQRDDNFLLSSAPSVGELGFREPMQLDVEGVPQCPSEAAVVLRLACSGLVPDMMCFLFEALLSRPTC